MGFGAIESDVGEGGSGVREAFSREIEEMLWFAWAHNLSFSTLQAEWSERLERDKEGSEKRTKEGELKLRPMPRGMAKRAGTS